MSNGDYMSDTEATGPSAGAEEPRLGWMPVAVAFIVISAALGGVLAFNVIMEPNLDESEVTATIIIDFGNGTVDSKTVTTLNYTVLGLLEEKVGFWNLDMTHYEGLGWLVNGIDGVANGAAVPGIEDTGTYYWQYYVNDVLGPVSADRYALQDGDVLEWRFEEIVW
jgi:hypothetical protein